MPIFEYSCRKCGHHFEKLQKGAEAGVVTCPSCGSDQVKKEISAFSSGNAAPAHSCSSGG
ncbi:zinc ribbon domain-containing protein [Geotalea sp. SG265]|uniref:FmdB family zinc ribbon protein n=1 Tax=Geotalea sp. SG265 TaxID=2922867 RepID=UPI001FAEB62B|nr:zinc ribbon domain-containing protein [Geotalea sp. SG265]